MSVYSEVVAESAFGYHRDRVLDTLQNPDLDLPYNLDTIKISHNDFAVSDVYNDSIKKLYSNYLFLIANAEITTNISPLTSDIGYVKYDANNAATKVAITTAPHDGTGTSNLSGTVETFVTNKIDSSNKLVFFNYSISDNNVFEANYDLTSLSTSINDRFVEFNKTFTFNNVVSVDSIGSTLFVLDKGLNTVFKFDVTGLLTDDPALKRTSYTDTEHPGRFLLKTIGGQGTSQTKNKLSNPSSLSVYKDRIYILDNGNNSVKVFDLDFNFLHELSSPELFNNPNFGEPVSIVVSKKFKTLDIPWGYILTSRGNILEYDVRENRYGVVHSPYDIYDTRLQTLSSYNETSSWKKIINSKSDDNILYISNDKEIYKFYKTNFNLPVSVLNLRKANISMNNDSSGQRILSFDNTLYDGADYLAVTTVLNKDNSKTQTYVVMDKNIPTKLYNESFYTNYFSLSDILILPQEIVNNITFNKTTKKLLYNHYSLFENINKKVYSYYQDVSGYAIVPTLCTVTGKDFAKPTSFDDTPNLYIGINEPILTDVINRPLEILYDQQKDIFNTLKEESLNNNPPSNIPSQLPGRYENALNVVTLTATEASVPAGTDVEVGVVRTNALSLSSSCSFKVWTTLGTAATTDFEYINEENPSVFEFKPGDTTITFSLETFKEFNSTSKTFSLYIEQDVNCVVDYNFQKLDVTITPIEDMYSVSVSTSFVNINEGTAARVGFVRHNVNEDYKERTGILVEIDTDLSDSVYIPNIASVTTHTTIAGSTPEEDMPGVPNSPDFFMTSAAEIKDTGTIWFNEGVSSVVFDVSAINDLSQNTGSKKLDIVIKNPTAGSNISPLEKRDYIDPSRTSVFIGDAVPKPIFLNLTSIAPLFSAHDAPFAVPDVNSGTITNMVSNVNIWEALVMSTAESNTNAFSAVSASHPISACFTVNAPLSVISVSALSGALDFSPPSNAEGQFVYTNNRIDIIIEEGAAVVGKGGRGGHGWLWESGSDFAFNGTDDISIYNQRIGEDGGPAIGNFDTYFDNFTITNAGSVIGGAGGGAPGHVGLSASVMHHVSALSAGSGGGGGAGIHVSNAGLGGLAAVGESTQDSLYTFSFRRDGFPGGVNVGGEGGGHHDAGGTSHTYPFVPIRVLPGSNSSTDIGDGTGTPANLHINVTKYPVLCGKNGGNIGEAGGTDTSAVEPDQTPATGTSFSTVSDEFAERTGGNAGRLMQTSKQVIYRGSGYKKGNETNIVE